MSSIEWTGKTWNPIVGCSKISAGCQNCYAINQAYRNAAIGKTMDNPDEWPEDLRVRQMPAVRTAYAVALRKVVA